MDPVRRSLLKRTGLGAALAAAFAAGMLEPADLLAAQWNKSAFGATDLAGALKGIGAGHAASSAQVVLTAPDIAADGAAVPVAVASDIPNTESIAILVDRNPNPLAASFEFHDGALPEVSIELKLAETSDIKAVAKADGKPYATQKQVKVTLGPCDC